MKQHRIMVLVLISATVLLAALELHAQAQNRPAPPPPAGPLDRKLLQKEYDRIQGQRKANPPTQPPPNLFLNVTQKKQEFEYTFLFHELIKAINSEPTYGVQGQIMRLFEYRVRFAEQLEPKRKYVFKLPMDIPKPAAALAGVRFLDPYKGLDFPRIRDLESAKEIRKTIEVVLITLEKSAETANIDPISDLIVASIYLAEKNPSAAKPRFAKALRVMGHILKNGGAMKEPFMDLMLISAERAHAWSATLFNAKESSDAEFIKQSKETEAIVRTVKELRARKKSP